MNAKLPREIPRAEHLVEEIVHGYPSWRVVAGYGAELRLRRLGHQPRAGDFCPCGARRAPRGHEESLVPGREVAGCLLYRLAVVGPNEPRVSASHVHVHRGLLRAATEETWLRDDGTAGEPLLSDAEPALHRRVAVPGPQRPVVGGRRGEVPGMDIGCGVGRAQWCVSSVRQRMVRLCPLRNRAERPHCWGPEVDVAVMTGDYELGVAGAPGRVL